MPAARRTPARDRTLPTVISCIDSALRAIGGAPTCLLTDNEKTMTIDRVTGIAVRHPQVVAAGRHYGLQVHICVPFDPEFKGGGEATVRIAKTDLILDLGKPAGEAQRLRRTPRGPRDLLPAGQHPRPPRDRQGAGLRARRSNTPACTRYPWPLTPSTGPGGNLFGSGGNRYCNGACPSPRSHRYLTHSQRLVRAGDLRPPGFSLRAFLLANCVRGIDADHRNPIIQLLDTPTHVRYVEHFRAALHRRPDSP